MMNLRILKKHSKIAYDFMKKYNLLWDGCEYYPAKRLEDFHNLTVRCRNPVHRKKKYPCCNCDHPLPGTKMSGSMEGYYEPEWISRTCYSELRDKILYGDDAAPPGCTEKEYARIKRVLGIEKKHFDAIRIWMEEGYANANT